VDARSANGDKIELVRSRRKRGGRKGGRGGRTFDSKDGTQTRGLEDLGLEHHRGRHVADGEGRVKVEVLELTGHA